jgi:hypothetical protein
LSKITKSKREKIKVNKTRDEKENITEETNEIQSITREYFEKLYSNKLENLEEMDKFLKSYNLSKLYQEDVNNY